MSDYFYSLHMAVAETIWADNSVALAHLRNLSNEENT